MSKDFLYPLRVLHGRLYEWNLERKRLLALRREITMPKGEKVYMIGLPEHTNLGDSAIAIAQEKFLKQHLPAYVQIKTVSYNAYTRDRDHLRKWIPKGCLVTQLGGGNMGNQWLNEEYFRRNVMEDFPKNPMIIFPQTIYYGADAQGQKEELASRPIYDGRKDLVLAAREAHSAEIMDVLYPHTKCLLVPDIVLYMDMAGFGVATKAREGIMLCMRSDAERAMTEELRAAVEAAARETGCSISVTDMHSAYAVTQENRGVLVREKMEEFAAARLVITDRLHGMIFAAITGTPCIALGNYNHKVSGVYEWIRYLPYIRFAETAGDVERQLPQLLAMEGCVYDNSPLLPHFEKLAQVVRKYANDQRDRSGL